MPERQRIVIVGGSDAGISAALRARQVAPDWSVEVVVADAFPNYSICGIPFLLSGEVPTVPELAHRTQAEIEATGIQLRLDTRAVEVDPTGRRLRVDGPGGVDWLPYDSLVLGTGAQPRLPRGEGFDHPAALPLHAMATALEALDRLVTGTPSSAIVVGTGYIGIEMADALRVRGVPDVTLVGRNPTPLPTVDGPVGEAVRETLERGGVRVLGDRTVEAVEPLPDGRARVLADGGPIGDADVVFLATGVRPETDLGERAGVPVGPSGALVVDQQMRTDVPGIYAAGDCIETWHRLLQRPVWLPLGTTAHKQGRVAGENAVGGRSTFAGVLGTQVVKVFDQAIGRTGLREDEAQAAGFETLSTTYTGDDHKAYYPGATRTLIRVLGDPSTGRLLGAQMMGHWRSGLAKRLDVFATALHHEATVASVMDLDLSYTPPLGSPWDVIQQACDGWLSAAGA